MQNATNLTITNPLVLYRALVSTNRIRADPSQLRLALHLQKLYDRLKDYEPTVEYSQRLQRLGRAIGPATTSPAENVAPPASRGIWQSLLKEQEKRDSLALTRVLSDHEEALKLDSPKGLMVHGEVGTGKSMLIDLFAECLPTLKKRRWHFNTFMLETFSKLEQLRMARLSRTRSLALGLELDDHSILWLARDLIEKSPILFLDEFQLPDRASAKIMTNLMTSFFGLGGVLVATSNRMPDELAKAAGIEFVPQPRAGRRGILGWSSVGTQGGNKMFGGGQGEFAQFLELLKARCEVWEMEGKSDYRRSSAKEKAATQEAEEVSWIDANQTGSAGAVVDNPIDEPGLPTKYFVQPDNETGVLPQELEIEVLQAVSSSTLAVSPIPWQPTTLKVYGRTVLAPHTFDNIAYFTFTEICAATLGPADYITLASTFHTFVITDVPVLTNLLKNEARRFITLLDALYEARCKLLISAQADPDNLFFPETRQSKTDVSNASSTTQEKEEDATYAETFSEIYQDTTAPFRPNVSSYEDTIDRTHSRLQGILAEDALEDDPPNKIKRMLGRTDSDFLEDEKYEVKRTPNFANTSIFTGEDEKFAYKRATSRLWEMCGRQWWERREAGWWRPLPLESRGWERSNDGTEKMVARSPAVAAVIAEIENTRATGEEGKGDIRDVNEHDDEVMFRHDASPFRSNREPPPKISWTHIWGTMKWGKRAGAWGQGVEGLKDRKKGSDR